MKKSFLLFFIVSAIYLFFEFSSWQLLWQLRLPRYLLSLFAGGSLCLVGHIYQQIFRNQLVEPYILGISSGAAFGSCLAFLSGFFLLMPLFGFLGALLTMLIVFRVANSAGIFSSSKLIICGVVLNFLFYSLISLLLYLLADSRILGILLGNFDYIFLKQEFYLFLFFLLFMVIIIFSLFRLRRQVEILSFGNQLAHSVGVDIYRLKKRIFLFSSILVGFFTAFIGIVPFVGLIVPNLLRRMKVKEFSSFFWFGASFLLFCDFICQFLLPWVLPVGVVTSILGSFLFLLILGKGGKVSS